MFKLLSGFHRKRQISRFSIVFNFFSTQASLDSSGVTLRHHRQYHHHHRQQLSLQQQQQQSHVATCRHRVRSPSAGAGGEQKESPPSQQHQQLLLSVDHQCHNNEDGGDTDSSSSNSNSNLCPNASTGNGSGRIGAAVGPEGFQSFPLDETSVYTHHHHCSSCNPVKSSKSTGSENQLIRNNRDASPHSASSRRRPGTSSSSRPSLRCFNISALQSGKKFHGNYKSIQ